MRHLILGLALLVVPTAASAVTFSDGTFAPADWLTSVHTFNHPGGSAAQVLTGGNPAEHRTSVHLVANSGASRIVVIGLRVGAVVDPSTLGGIGGVNYSEDSMCATVDGCTVGGQGRFPALIQGGTFYINVSAGNTLVLNSWTPFSTTGLIATDFEELSVTSTGTVIAGSHPDFTASGAPIQFGYARGNSSSNARTGRIDNWSVTVSGTATPVSNRTWGEVKTIYR